MRAWLCIAVSAGALLAARADPAAACSPEEVEDFRHYQSSAPPGGAWWLHGQPVGDLRLSSWRGTEDAQVVSVGERSFAIRVPGDALASDVFGLSGLEVDAPLGSPARDGFAAELHVEGEALPDRPAPALGEVTASLRDEVQVLARDLVLPTWIAPCRGVTGVFVVSRDDFAVPTLTAELTMTPSERAVVDLWRGPAGEDFDLDAATILLDGLIGLRPDPASERTRLVVEVPLQEDPEDDGEAFRAHLRVRDPVTGLASELRGVDVFQPPAAHRREVGCSGVEPMRGRATGAWVALLLWGALLLARRRR